MDAGDADPRTSNTLNSPVNGFSPSCAILDIATLLPSQVHASSDDATWEARLRRDMTRSASDPPPLLGAGRDVVDVEGEL